MCRRSRGGGEGGGGRLPAAGAAARLVRAAAEADVDVAVVAARVADEGVLVAALGPQVMRAVTHLDVSREQVERAAEVIERIGAA